MLADEFGERFVACKHLVAQRLAAVKQGDGGAGFARDAVDRFANGDGIHVAHLLADELELASLRAEASHAAEFDDFHENLVGKADALELLVAELRHLASEILERVLLALELGFGGAAVAVFVNVVFVDLFLAHGKALALKSHQNPYDSGIAGRTSDVRRPVKAEEGE